MNKKILLSGLTMICLLAGGAVWADRVEHATEVVPADNYESVEVDLDFGAGRIDIVVADMAEPAKLDVVYSPRVVDYEFEYNKRGSTCQIFAESEIKRRRVNHDDIDNEWELQLSSRYSTDLKMDIGACEGDFDLGGLPLTGLSIDVGAADLHLEFSDPNPERMRELKVDCGASSLVIDGLANANCDMMFFNVGAGSCDLDFRGDISGETEVDIDVGVGSMDISVSRDIAVRIVGDDDWFSSFDIRGLDLEEVDDEIWESPDFREAENRLIINVDVAMGSVDIVGRR